MNDYEEDLEKMEVEEEYEDEEDVEKLDEEEDYEDEEEYLDHNFQKDSTLDIKKTYIYFLKYAKAIQVISFICIIIIIIGSLVMAEDSDGFSLLMGVISSVIVYSVGLFQSASFKWKAYMLKCVFEIKEKK